MSYYIIVIVVETPLLSVPITYIRGMRGLSSKKKKITKMLKNSVKLGKNTKNDLKTQEKAYYLGFKTDEKEEFSLKEELSHPCYTYAMG